MAKKKTEPGPDAPVEGPGEPEPMPAAPCLDCNGLGRVARGWEAEVGPDGQPVEKIEQCGTCGGSGLAPASPGAAQ